MSARWCWASASRRSSASGQSNGCDPSHTLARALRNRLKSFVTFNMFFHDEHHLFPQVPTYRLATQAERIDAAAPGRAHQAGFLSSCFVNLEVVRERPGG